MKNGHRGGHFFFFCKKLLPIVSIRLSNYFKVIIVLHKHDTSPEQNPVKSWLPQPAWA
ncbi:protein of unknown function [Georgfuchsia toluolica]|uniref:Uncharacterized protein n=1 Tax=Georgfuchsia toluolica TaxID=424218 RepID=A0A916N3E2_9PROT|nr:protein of unknown function [Georgfuchsia toluolica]